jgi:ATP-binding cassette subfamily F protein uup
MKTVLMLLKRENKAKERKTGNNPTGNLTFNEQKNSRKLNEEIKDLEIQKVTIEQLFRMEKLLMLRKCKTSSKMELEERWFELSAKWKDKIRISVQS